MLITQCPENEIGRLLNNILPSVKKRKFQSLFLYLLALIYFSIPSFQVPLLGYSHLRITSVMEERALEHNLIFYPEQSWVNISDVNPSFLKAVLSLEDDAFFMHKGIDWNQLNKSLRENKRKKRIIRGGSTITMQLAKNLYLTTERSILRKAKEMIITFRIEKEVSKKSILENYVNAVEWGDGIFGIKEASSVYFYKEPVNLSLTECTRLAAVIPSPLEHKPNTNSKYVQHRAGLALARLNNVILFPE
jgi:monofunctional biosynthetic peptidoglycan transglycosylase